jgi:hypothetical protein
MQNLTKIIISGLLIPFEKDCVDEYIRAAAAKLGICRSRIEFIEILNKSLDFSCEAAFYHKVSIAAAVAGICNIAGFEEFPAYIEEAKRAPASKTLRDRPVIIGFGPAGMFAALELIEYGIRPLIFERGKKIEERSADIRNFIEKSVLDAESNIQFGEGGAGSFSDGKLFSRVKNSGHAARVLETFIKFGAPAEIAYAAKPHLGTDILCKIVKNIRNYILERGGEIFYGSKMTGMIISNGEISGVIINGADEYHSSLIYIAVGNSARDTLEMICRSGVMLEQKPVSIGVRIEHPAKIINLIRYGNKYNDFPEVAAAAYSFSYTDRAVGRGVYTFCMCPGGEIVNASSEQGMMALNGMSYSGRSSAFSNAAIVVTCRAGDYSSDHPLSGVEFQKDIERKAFIAAGGAWKCPAQNLTDFMRGEISPVLNINSFKMGAAPVQMAEIFPEFISGMLLSAFGKWKKECPQFVSEHAILLGPETRTSSAVKIVRGEKYESVNIKNLYPIGEGSGYTGGITSAASDAIRAVEASLAV